MARIFYFTDSGNVYGVHPGAFDGTLPDNVIFTDVLGPPDEINWPSPDGTLPGCEQWTRVNLVTKELEGRDDAIPPSTPSDALNATLIGLKETDATVDQLIDVLLGQVGKAGRADERVRKLRG